MVVYKKIKKIVIAILGFSVLLVGVLLIFLPGPAFIVIPVGLSILATEFLWARNLVEKIKSKIKRKQNKKEKL
jgi:uncharacterized protein (TIGR02611 family)